MSVYKIHENAKNYLNVFLEEEKKDSAFRYKLYKDDIKDIKIYAKEKHVSHLDEEELIADVNKRIERSQREVLELQDFIEGPLTWTESEKKPFRINRDIDLKLHGKPIEDNIYLYNNNFYYVKGPYSEQEKELLVMECFDRDRRKFERLTNRFEKQIETRNERPRIPESVRIDVWRRDQGKCAKCGSREKLEYDHIVPISKGGSNTTRNIELLCENCNRQKGSNIQ